MSSTNDEKLRELFSKLYDKHNKEVWLAAFIVLPNAASADEITQEVFLRFWKQLDAGETIDYPRAWLLRVAQNLALDYCESAFHRNGTIAPEVMDKNQSSDPGPQQEAEARELLSAALAALDPTDGQIIVLRFWEGKTIPQVSKLLGISRTTVHRRQHCALRQLQQYLAGL